MPALQHVMPLDEPGNSNAKPGSVMANTPLGCHLQAINSVAGIFDYGRIADFDILLKRGHGVGIYNGVYFTGTICSVASNSSAKTFDELEKRGFVILGTQPGAHGNYKMVLYGLGFTLPGKKG